MYFDPILLVITIVFAGIGMLVSFRLKSKFREFSATPLSSHLSGKEVAEKMLRDNGIYDVKVLSVSGMLTDHYDPSQKIVNLSESVYSERHVAAAAVAAHECGHAVQHAQAYRWLGFRSKMVPFVNISSNLLSFVYLAMAFGAYIMPHLGNTLLLVLIVLQATITLFTVVTLPVEIDASRRALAWLNQSHITYGEESRQAKSALSWAAMTYIIAALGAIATLLYYIMRYTGSRDDD